MIEIKALCANCGPDLYYEEMPVRFFAEGKWVEVESVQESIDLALAGVQLLTTNGRRIRPRAVFLVRGTAMCGLCVRSFLGPNSASKTGIFG